MATSATCPVVKQNSVNLTSEKNAQSTCTCVRHMHAPRNVLRSLLSSKILFTDLLQNVRFNLFWVVMEFPQGTAVIQVEAIWVVTGLAHQLGLLATKSRVQEDFLLAAAT
eukprot:5840273-Amphidinium_carterae.1